MGSGGFEPREDGRSLRSRCVFSTPNRRSHHGAVAHELFVLEMGSGGFEPKSDVLATLRATDRI